MLVSSLRGAVETVVRGGGVNRAEVAALVDADPRQVGTRIGDLVVEPAHQQAQHIAETGLLPERQFHHRAQLVRDELRVDHRHRVAAFGVEADRSPRQRRRGGSPLSFRQWTSPSSRC